MKKCIILILLFILGLIAPCKTFSRFCLTKSTNLEDLDFQKDSITDYPINVWISSDDTEVYECFQDQNVVLNRLPFRSRYKVVKNNYRIRSDRQYWSLLVNGNASVVSKETVVGWVSHQNIITNYTALIVEDTSIYLKVLVKEPYSTAQQFFSVSTNPNYHMNSEKNELKPIFYYVYDFFPKFAREPESSETKRVLIGSDSELSVTESKSSILIGWVDRSKLTFWKTRNACEFIPNRRVDLFDERGNVLFSSKRHKPLKFNEMRFPILKKNKNNFFICAFIPGGCVEGWVRSDNVKEYLWVSRTDIEVISKFLYDLSASFFDNSSKGKMHRERILRILLGDYNCKSYGIDISLEECNMRIAGIPIETGFMRYTFPQLINLNDDRIADLVKCEAKIALEQMRSFLQNRYISHIYLERQDYCFFKPIYEYDINGDGQVVSEKHYDKNKTFLLDRFFFRKKNEQYAWIPVNFFRIKSIDRDKKDSIVETTQKLPSGYFQVKLICKTDTKENSAIDIDEEINVLAQCSNKNIPLKYNEENFFFTGQLDCPQNKLNIKVSSEIFEPISFVPDNQNVTYEMKYTKPVLYVLINPSNEMNVSEFKHDPTSFTTFKKHFYNLCKILDSTQEIDWGDKWLRTYFYVQNKNNNTSLFPKNEKKTFINEIEFGNQSVGYETLIHNSIDFINGFSISNKILKGVCLFIGALSESKLKIEDILQRNKVAALIVQLGETGQEMKIINLSKYLTIIKMDIRKEFKDIKLNIPKERLKDKADIFFIKTFEKINIALKQLMSAHGFQFRYMN